MYNHHNQVDRCETGVRRVRGAVTRNGNRNGRHSGPEAEYNQRSHSQAHNV